jgi:hypothetical protein
MDVLGPEPEDEAQPRTNLHVVRRLHATTDQKAQEPPFPRPISIHIVVPAVRHLFGVACDGASVNSSPITTPSTAAKTKERGRSRSSGQEVHALITVSRTAVQRLCPPSRRAPTVSSTPQHFDIGSNFVLTYDYLVLSHHNFQPRLMILECRDVYCRRTAGNVKAIQLWKQS